MHKNRLNKKQIDEAMTLYRAGERKTVIAEIFDVDRTTIHYHIKKERVEPIIPTGEFNEDFFTEELLKLRKIQDKCSHDIEGHSAFKCFRCGLWKDNVKSKEQEEIRKQRRYIAYLLNKLDDNSITYLDVDNFDYSGSL